MKNKFLFVIKLASIMDERDINEGTTILVVSNYLH